MQVALARLGLNSSLSHGAGGALPIRALPMPTPHTEPHLLLPSPLTLMGPLESEALQTLRGTRLGKPPETGPGWSQSEEGTS